MANRGIFFFLWFWTMVILTTRDSSATSTVEHKVFCTDKEMTVTVNLPNAKTQVYVDKLKDYPDCKPIIEGSKATFHLSLDDIFTCGTTRILDMKGRKLFYNKIVVESAKSVKDKIRAKCEIFPNNAFFYSVQRRRKRDVLPEGFVEPEHINITETVIGNGVFPELNVGVRQNGNYIDTQMNVQPGTPLEMEVFLDHNSSATYGVLVTSMNVTDKTPGLKEIIIFKGCSIDPYLFSNFELRNDNSVSAKFRAFKFPDSSYVLFIGSVSICIGACQGILCSNGELGYGRRRKRDFQTEDEDERRRNPESSLLDWNYRDPNQIFEITMTTILKINETDTEFVKQDSLGNSADPASPSSSSSSSSDARIPSSPPLVIVAKENVIEANFNHENIVSNSRDKNFTQRICSSSWTTIFFAFLASICLFNLTKT